MLQNVCKQVKTGGSSFTGAEDAGMRKAFIPPRRDRGRSRHLSQRTVTSSRETVTEEPVQPTASIVLSLAGNRKFSKETVAGAVGIRNPRTTCGVQNVSA